MSLRLDNLSFSYPGHTILSRVSLTLESGEIGTLIGSSGSGKSTLFKLIAGLLPLQQGTVQVMNHSVPLAYQHLAYMTQQDLLLPWRTVLDNVLLIAELGPQMVDMIQVKEEACLLLEDIGLSRYVNYYPDELSGGMRQRVSLARALLLKKPALLLDEPFGALDVGLREHLYRLLHRIRDKYGTTILLVTHDFRDAISLSDRLFLLAQQSIHKEWTLSNLSRADFNYVGLLQQEMQELLNYSSNN
ncbi:putative ABC-type transporter, ATPase subunit [Candidatus Protochlamydia naegleriophila]|uniref:Putative ABC-type transporter, ATPase subunit n=1 Tax=Candidatus Protochlamydia naegleriophila TaxID=389348 RepID=A0A0U5JH98_9BACT|nr:ATP-binding cassette domain-containing protein [Candidatus Protochlamydia naegleriophila]CUI17333.1 putative ABC-type transporter, ATPase subunit [Candidatus Protochlamydia naegleriophila]